MKRLLIGTLVTVLTLGIVGKAPKAEAGKSEWKIAAGVLAGILVLDALNDHRPAPMVYQPPVFCPPAPVYQPPMVYAPAPWRPPVCQPPMGYAPAPWRPPVCPPAPVQIWQNGYGQGYGPGQFQQGQFGGFKPGTHFGYPMGFQGGPQPYGHNGRR
jgi:hypothetical protein